MKTTNLILIFFLFAKLTFAQIGLNGFHWVPFDNIPCNNFRMYQELQWTWTSDGLAVEPTRQADGNYDTWLKAAKSRGIEIVFCPNRVPNWWFTDSQRQSDLEWPDRRLHRWGGKGTDPREYYDICQYYWQLTARYGREKYDESMLFVNNKPRWTNDPVTKKLSGLNLLNYVEVENEPDRPWKDAEHKYTPEQYAALLSAAFDGHEGRLGPTGIKNADPSMKVVLGGLSAIDIPYLEKMNLWFKTNRTDKKFPVDVINVHHYTNLNNPFPGNSINLVGGKGVSPEADYLGIRLKSLTDWVKVNLGKKEVWYSEFGWDTQTAPNPWISQYPFLYNRRTAEELQAIWAVRAYLIAIESGVNVSHFYNAIDEPAAEQGGLFQSSGMSTSQRNGYKKKQSFYDVTWLVKQLKGYKFIKSHQVKGVKVLEFKNGFRYRYFYWSPTSNDTVVRFKIGTTTLDATEKVNSFNSDRSFFDKIIGKDPKVSND